MNSAFRTAARAAALASLTGACIFAQSVISARSGVVHYSEGSVFVGDTPVDHSKFGVFPDIKEKGSLRTEAGRAEILLNPGVFLRVGENSEIRMISTRLIDTRVDFVSGQAVVEVDDPLKENSVAIVYKDFTVQLKKHGIYSFESEPAQLKVYSGEADVTSGGSTVAVKDGRLLPFTVAMASEKFDNKTGDAMFNWSKRRSEYVSYANVSAAKSLKDSGSEWRSGSWYFNPYYSMYTYIPMGGTIYSPFGYGFWSPYTVYNVLMPRPVYSAPAYSGYGGGYSGGYNGIAHTSGGLSGAVVAASGGGAHVSAPTSGGAASAGASHGGGHAGGHGR